MKDIWEPHFFTISSRRKETKDTFTLTLKPPKGTALKYLPGQFNMLYHFGSGEVPISISASPQTKKEIIHTIRAVGSVTQGLERLRTGDMIGIRGPFGTSWPVDKALGKDLLVIAGGIGLAPLRPVVQHFIKHRKKFGSGTLLYGVRQPADLLFKSEHSKWKKAGLQMQVTVDAPDKNWKGNVGVVTTLIDSAKTHPSSTLALLCGPELMMKFCVKALLARGYAEDNIYVSMERNMKCAVGFCGHCQYGPKFICKDGPVFKYPDIKQYLEIHQW